MLRLILGAVALLALSGALLSAWRGAPVVLTVWLAGLGVILAVGGVWERVNYKRVLPRAPGRGFVATPERFVDPASGRMVQVHVKPETGERVYVDTGPAPPQGRA
jgi:hypothetical protein